MLVLTRKQQEKIQIGEDIVITVLKTKGKTVRIGVEAPSTVPVLRGELAVRIREEASAEAGADAGAARPDARPGVTGREPLEDAPPRSPVDEQGPRPAGGEPRVSLERVPRSRVATVLSSKLGPRAAEGGGPLRAMLDRRTGALL